jgi:hypothetical protein
VKRFFAAAAGAAVLIGLAGCGGSTDGTATGPGALSMTESVCDEFAGHVKDGQPRAERPEVVRSMSLVMAKADQRLQDAFPVLQRTVAGTDGAWKIAADTFAQACFDVGWDG